MNIGEPAIDPDRPIIDPHMHLWHNRQLPDEPRWARRFLLEEAAEAVALSGHAVTHTVFVECGQMYRTQGPEDRRSLGETEFANGLAAMSASGGYGPCLMAHRIVSEADLCLGDRVRDILEPHVACAGERFRGVRMNTAFSPAGLHGYPCDPAAQYRLEDPGFVAGARVLAAMGLSLDVWCLHPQLAQVIALADALPKLTIVLDHLGTPDTTGRWQQHEQEAFVAWREAIQDLARRDNVRVKLGGMGMDLNGPMNGIEQHASSGELASAWAPRVETCIAAFTPDRAMFESNCPPDLVAASYVTIWNAFKRICAGYSEHEKDALFRRTAAATYKIAL